MNLLINSFAGNSTISCCNCYKKTTFYLTINVFWSQQHIVQRKSFFACMLVKFAGVVYKESFPATRKRFIPHKYRNINANTCETHEYHIVSKYLCL